MKILCYVTFNILCLFLNGCGGCCQDRPIPIVKYDRIPNSDTVTLGDTISVIDRSYCKNIQYYVSTYPLDSYKRLLHFPIDSNFGSFKYIGEYRNILSKFYADSASNAEVFDTTSRLQFKFIMNGDTGKHIIIARGSSTFTECGSTGWPVNANVPVESVLRDTIYVKRK